MAALYYATIPIYTVVVRRAFGVAGGTLSDPDDGTNTRVAWYAHAHIATPGAVVLTNSHRPSGDWGSLPLEGGVEAAYKRQLDSATSPAAREQMLKDLLAQFEDIRDPIRTAHAFGIDEIIDPRDTRPLACEVSL